MLYFGIDVVTMSALGILCVALCMFICKELQVTSTEGRAAALSATITALVMIAGYILMARVLDSTVGIYW